MTGPAAVELFASGGGLALGAERAGFRHEALVEWDPDACDTLRAKWGDRVVVGPYGEGDVRRLDFHRWDGVDLIAGGPPCQPFSTAGTREMDEDPRDMFPEMLRAVEEARPRAAFIENVAGLLKGDARAYFKRAIARLEGFGYDVAWRLVNFADHGVPQKRERVIAVALRRDLGARFEWPAPTHSEDALLWAQWGDGGSYWREKGIAAPEDAEVDLERLERPTAARALRRWRTVRDVVRPGTGDGFQLRREKGLVEVHDPDEPAYTITRTKWNNKLLRVEGGCGLRYLTVGECAALQTFPAGWPFAGRNDDARLAQVGNAVPPDGAAVLMAAVRDALA